MASLQLILTSIFRSLGKILNTAFGWATALLFGKVPEKRQLYLSAIALASILWLVVLLGVIFPRFAAFLLAFVPMQSIAHAWWVRIVMLAAAVLLPAGVGVLSLFLVDPDQRPKTAGDRIKTILKGYPFSLGLALTILLMILFAPVMKARDFVRRWTSTHIPMVVAAKDYLSVVGDVERVLRDGGLETTRDRASWMLRLPTKLLTLFAGGAVHKLVADQMTVLKRPDLEVLLHPSDLIIRGKDRDVTRTHALLTEHLTFTHAYQTWTKEANQIEDRFTALWNEAHSANGSEMSGSLQKLEEIGRDMSRLEIPYEEWEVLLREKLILERALLRVAAGLAEEPEDATGPREGAATSDGMGHTAGPTRRSHPISRRAAADNFSASKRS